jgi:hypothetical protein
VQRFVEALYTKWDQFLQPPRHPKWGSSPDRVGDFSEFGRDSGV